MISLFWTQQFTHITARPKTMVLCCVLLIAALAAGLGSLVKDTSIEAFVPPGHASLAANNQVRETFGLTDAIAIAVETQQNSIFNAQDLNRVAQISEFLQNLDNVRADRVVSITTESAISGEDGAVDVSAYFDAAVDMSAAVSDAAVKDALTASLEIPAQAAEAQRLWQAMPPHIGTLVSADQRAAIIMGEIQDITQAQATYAAVRTFVASLPTEQTHYHVAGPGAVSGYFSAYIEQDARFLIPVSFALVLLFVFFAFRRASAIIGPLCIVMGCVLGTLGAMAWVGIPYYAITNALPVVLVAIAVADAIHVLTAYYEARRGEPTASNRQHSITALSRMAKPIILTTLTTMAGFVGIGLVSAMPPIAAFAWFACFGSALAGLLTLLLLPNLLILLPPATSPAFAQDTTHQPQPANPFGQRLAAIAGHSARQPVLATLTFAVWAVLALLGASTLHIDRSQIANFTADEPIRIADEFINQQFVGTGFLNVVVSSNEDDGLLRPENMQAIADLQRFMERQPHVQKTVSIVDYLSVLRAAVEGQPVSRSRMLPTGEDAIAQYLLIYETSGSPTDFEEEIDPYYRTALVRGFLNASTFSDSKLAVAQIQDYLDTRLGGIGLSASLAGDLNLTYHWMQQLIDKHFVGIGVSITLVLLMAAILFRSLAFGLVAVVPVAFTVLVIYGVMGITGINLEPPTSMFAAIAVGVGVDFAIHLVARLREAQAQNGGDLHQAIVLAMPSTARACFFNAAALAVGFAVLMVSDLPTLQRFGGLISLAALASFAASLLLLPALLAWIMRALPARRREVATSKTTASATATSEASVSATAVSTANGQVTNAAAVNSWAASTLAATLLLAALITTFSSTTLAAEATVAADLTGLQLATQIADRRAGAASTRQLRMGLTDRRGRTRERLAVVHKVNGELDQRTRITYLEPKAVRNVGFLSHDFHNARKTDERWLYLPAARKVRRIPASDRGDYFLGTDFTYADMQSELKFDLTDYQFTNQGLTPKGLVVLTGQPTSTKVAKELGYGGFRAEVDSNSWIPMKIEFTDAKSKPLKTVTVTKVEHLDGVWTAQGIRAENHQTGHKTQFDFQQTQYYDTLASNIFQSAQLSRGAPAR